MTFKLLHLQTHIAPHATTFQINSYLKTTPPNPGFDPAPPCTTTLSFSSIPASCIQNFHHSVSPCFEFKLLFTLQDPPWNFKGYSNNSNMTSSRFYRKISSKSYKIKSSNSYRKKSSKFYRKKSSRFYIKFFPIIFRQVEANQSVFVVNMMNQHRLITDVS